VRSLCAATNPLALRKKGMALDACAIFQGTSNVDTLPRDGDYILSFYTIMSYVAPRPISPENSDVFTVFIVSWRNKPNSSDKVPLLSYKYLNLTWEVPVNEIEKRKCACTYENIDSDFQFYECE
jgi:hypothetical protein